MVTIPSVTKNLLIRKMTKSVERWAEDMERIHGRKANGSIMKTGPTSCVASKVTVPATLMSPCRHDLK